MKNKKEQDYIKANRKGSREAEIELYGKPLNHNKVYQSKKTYNRKRDKAGLRNLPYLFISNPTIVSLLHSIIK